MPICFACSHCAYAHTIAPSRPRTNAPQRARLPEHPHPNPVPSRSSLQACQCCIPKLMMMLCASQVYKKTADPTATHMSEHAPCKPNLARHISACSRNTHSSIGSAPAVQIMCLLEANSQLKSKHRPPPFPPPPSRVLPMPPCLKCIRVCQPHPLFRLEQDIENAVTGMLSRTTTHMFSPTRPRPTKPSPMALILRNTSSRKERSHRTNEAATAYLG